MKLLYGYNEIPKGYEELTSNYEAFNIIMGSLELSGVFSDSLIQKMYGLCTNGIILKEKLYDKAITQDEFNIKRKELHDDFSKIFNVYSIFSHEFKTSCLSHFHSIFF